MFSLLPSCTHKKARQTVFQSYLKRNYLIWRKWERQCQITWHNANGIMHMCMEWMNMFMCKCELNLFLQFSLCYATLVSRNEMATLVNNSLWKKATALLLETKDFSTNQFVWLDFYGTPARRDKSSLLLILHWRNWEHFKLNRQLWLSFSYWEFPSCHKDIFLFKPKMGQTSGKIVLF